MWKCCSAATGLGSCWLMCIKSVMLFTTSAICRERMYRLTYPCSTSLTACNTQSHSANTSLFFAHTSHKVVSDNREQHSCCGLQSHACRSGIQPGKRRICLFTWLDADDLLQKAEQYCEADCQSTAGVTRPAAAILLMQHGVQEVPLPQSHAQDWLWHLLPSA